MAPEYLSFGLLPAGERPARQRHVRELSRERSVQAEYEAGTERALREERVLRRK